MRLRSGLLKDGSVMPCAGTQWFAQAAQNAQRFALTAEEYVEFTRGRIPLCCESVRFTRGLR